MLDDIHRGPSFGRTHWVEALFLNVASKKRNEKQNEKTTMLKEKIMSPAADRKKKWT